ENAAQSFADSGTERVEIVGLMRAPELPNFATPGNSDGLDKEIWFIRNIAAMSNRAGLNQTVVAPYFIDEQSLRNGALPQGGETRVQFSNRHLGYVITWYGLALALMGVFFVFAYREYKKGREPTPT
ncbi:MAG: SURF1 family protein, partial [Rhizobiales bacterium]|nr:SURF1 family protein [Hyphomicrobiales bacterium]